jgi:uridine kinase
LRIVVDGFTASGKTSFAHELAAELRQLGRPTLRACLDDFKKPWRDAKAKGYDRVSGDGYYRNAPDFESARTLLLEPAGPHGSGTVVLCAHDPLTGIDHRDVTVDAPPDAVLVVDTVFAMRPEYDEFWDLRIWIDVAPELALARGIERDAAAEGRAEAQRLHRDRYHASEQIYIDEVDPKSRADVVIDNTEFASPVLRRS